MLDARDSSISGGSWSHGPWKLDMSGHRNHISARSQAAMYGNPLHLQCLFRHIVRVEMDAAAPEVALGISLRAVAGSQWIDSGSGTALPTSAPIDFFFLVMICK